MIIIFEKRKLIVYLLLTVSLTSMFSRSCIITYSKDSDSDDSKYIGIEELGTEKTGTISQVVDIQIDDEQVIRVGITDNVTDNNYTNIERSVTSSVQYTSDDDLDIEALLSSANAVKKEKEEEEQRKKALASRKYTTTTTQGGLLDIESPDSSYKGKAISITGEDRRILEHLVMGEAGGEGFEGAAIVAQCIRDMYILGGFDSVESVRVNCGYTGSLEYEPNQDVLDAVSYIFDEGGYAVKHRILYFYAPKLSKGTFHETQNHILTYKNHKIFDRNS